MLFELQVSAVVDNGVRFRLLFDILLQKDFIKQTTLNTLNFVDKTVKLHIIYEKVMDIIIIVSQI